MPVSTLSRRKFLQFAFASTFLTACGTKQKHKSIGLALGGGGAKGLAHILMFEALEELGLRPARIAGTSIGAVLGVMYAAGMNSKEILAVIDRLTVAEEESWLDSLFNEDVFRFLDLRRTSGSGSRSCLAKATWRLP